MIERGEDVSYHQQMMLLALLKIEIVTHSLADNPGLIHISLRKCSVDKLYLLKHIQNITTETYY